MNLSRHAQNRDDSAGCYVAHARLWPRDVSKESYRLDLEDFKTRYIPIVIILSENWHVVGDRSCRYP